MRRREVVYLNSLLDRGEWLVLCSGRFDTVDRTNDDHWIGPYWGEGRLRSRSRQGEVQKSVPFSEFEPQISSLSPCRLFPTLSELPWPMILMLVVRSPDSQCDICNLADLLLRNYKHYLVIY